MRGQPLDIYTIENGLFQNHRVNIKAKKMRVLIACEESQSVCKAFRLLGHEAYSCDIQECSGGHPEWHLQQDLIPLLEENWDLIIAHPPCTYLSNAGIRWFNEERYGEQAKQRKRLRIEAMQFVLQIANCSCPKIVIENPIGWLNSQWRKPDQVVQPWMFGDTFNKPTCLWLKGVPKLSATNIVSRGEMVTHLTKKGVYKTDSKWYYYAVRLPADERRKFRSKTFQGIANAMADQWGKNCL